MISHIPTANFLAISRVPPPHAANVGRGEATEAAPIAAGRDGNAGGADPGIVARAPRISQWT